MKNNHKTTTKRHKMATKHSNKKRPQIDAKWAQSCEATTTRHKTTKKKKKKNTNAPQRHKLKTNSERIDHKISQTTTKWCKTVTKRCTMRLMVVVWAFSLRGLLTGGIQWSLMSLCPGARCAIIRPPCWHGYSALVELYILSTLSPRYYIYICFAGKGNFAWIMLFSIWDKSAMFWTELWLWRMGAAV